MIVCSLHAHFDEAHLADVIEQMRVLGPPVLRGYHDAESGAWLMREGTHRLRAALHLGLAPALRPISWWRSRASLERARHAAAIRGHDFPCVEIRS